MRRSQRAAPCGHAEIAAGAGDHVGQQTDVRRREAGVEPRRPPRDSDRAETLSSERHVFLTFSEEISEAQTALLVVRLLSHIRS